MGIAYYLFFSGPTDHLTLDISLCLHPRKCEGWSYHKCKSKVESFNKLGVGNAVSSIPGDSIGILISR